MMELKCYNAFSGSQQRDGRELLEILREDIGEERQSIIVDVGCRSGLSTKLLSEAVLHDTIYAMDIDPKMISFAQTNSPADSVQYLTQAVDVPWERLSPVLQNLEGTVDLVFSNRFLHWAKDKATAIKNIGRLLRPGGRFYANITLMRDIYEYLTEEERQESEKIMKFVTHEKQCINWKNHLDAVFATVKVQVLHKDWTFENPEDIHGLFKTVEPFIRKNMFPDSLEDDKVAFLDRFRDLMTRVTQSKFGEPPSNSVDPDNKTTYYGQYRVKAIKH